VANEKISELPAGSPAQPSDAIPIARGGQNFSIAVSDIGGGGGGGGGINASFGGNTAGVLSLVSSGTLFLAGGNNVTLSQNGNSVTISANTAAAANLSISAGTTTGQFGGVTFGNANNVSFGLNNGTITATASQSNQTDGIYMLGNTTGQSSSNTHDARSLSIIASGLISAGWSGASLLLSAPTLPPLFSGIGISTGGNTAGITGVQSQQIVLVGGNNVTLSGSAAGGSGTVSINVPSQTNQTVGIYAQSQTFGQSSSSTYDARSLSLVGQGNIQIGQSGASIFISGASNSGASGDIFAAGNTTGQSSSSAYPLNSFNISFAGIISGGWSSNSLIVSAPASTGISQSMLAASNTTLGTSGTQSIGSLVLAGAGNVSVGVSNGSYVISGAGGGGGGGVNFGVSTAGNTAGATGTVSTGNVVLVGSGPISLSQATGAAGSAATITINAPAISSISGTGNLSVAIAGSTISLGANAAAVSIGGNSTSAGAGFSNVSSGTLVLAGGNNITLSQNGASVTISAGAGGGAQLSAGVSTGGNTSGNTGIYSGQVVFAGGNNITLSVSSGAAGAQTITISGANAGGAQTGISGLVVSNTTYTSGTVTFQNANGISFGSSGANGISASYTQSGQAFSAGGGSSTFSTLSFTNGNGVSFTNTAGSIGGIVATTQALFFAGNTTGQSSSSTIADQSISYSLGGALSGGMSGGSVLLSAPATSSISGTGLVSVAINASTISIGAAIPQLSFFQPLGPVQNTTVTQNGAGSVQVYPAIAAFPFSASRVDMMISASAAVLAVSTQAQTLSMFVGLYSLNASTLTLLSSGSQSYAMANSSNASNASITGIRRLSAPMNVNYTGGFDLFIGVMTNTTFANTNGISFSNVVVPLGPGQQLQGLIGQVPANSMQFVPGQGLWSTTSAGMPSSMAISAISGAGSGGNAVDNYQPVQFVNLTA
jgi:fibronectin-binding autotransporter adhesin